MDYVDSKGEFHHEWMYMTSELGGHDGQMVCQMIVDINKTCSEKAGLDFNGIFFKSDNSAEQFKSKHTITGWTRTCIALNKPLLWTWGIPGHGKDECDAAGGNYKSCLINPIAKGDLKLDSSRAAAEYVSTVPSTISKTIYQLPTTTS